MRIALEADHLFRYPLRGIQRTTLELYRHLAVVRPTWQVDAFHQAPGACPPLEEIPGLRITRIDIPGDRWRAQLDLWNNVRLPLAARGHDLLHLPSNLGSAWALVPIVLTVHDLTPVQFPTTDSDRWWRGVRRSALRARRIVTCSRFVADRLCEALPVLRSRVRTVSWGRSAAYRPCRAEEVEAVKRRHGIASSYVLTFVTSHPRKNAARVVAAWTALPDWVHREYQLVVVGIRGVTPSDDARVRYLVDVPEDDMPALTTGAAAMCYLSLSEGFGLPVLEAFSCGTPVIASSTSSLPEIAGDAAVLADPASPPAIQDAIVRVLSSADLRGELRERGLARATLFDWRDCAEAYAQIFEECLG